jgi:TetR/AcrR family transcriptional regulator, transcriptional repressor for nem operon
MRPMMKSDTREAILSAAQLLAQQRGFNAFSYADISQFIGIRKASIHYHFPSKDDLELALLQRYVTNFEEAVNTLEISEPGPVARLRAYGALYRRTLDAGGICLCGMMASDIVALPIALRAPLGKFFTDQTQWLSSTLEAGRRQGVLVFPESALLRSQSMLASLQGGLIMARALENAALFDELMDDLLTGVGHH